MRQKVTKENAEKIRKLAHKDVPYKEIAQQYNISPSTITNIRKGRRRYNRSNTSSIMGTYKDIKPILDDPEKMVNLAERLFEVVKIPADYINECWSWNKSNTDTYQTIMIRRKNFFIHRLFWMLWHGQDIPKDMVVRHVGCSNKLCCNPYHLKMGTHADNMKDMMLKNGRIPMGKTQYISVPIDYNLYEKFKRIAYLQNNTLSSILIDPVAKEVKAYVKSNSGLLESIDNSVESIIKKINKQ